MTRDDSTSPTGKLLIVAMLASGSLLAGFSWWFRFQATHRAAQFWGAAAAEMIRDAPSVELRVLNSQDRLASRSGVSGDRVVNAPAWKDVSRAPGLTHLRNALLEDRSFDFELSADNRQLTEYGFALRFGNEQLGRELTVLFSADCSRLTYRPQQGGQQASIACDPIAQGLRTVFAEQAAE